VQTVDLATTSEINLSLEPSEMELEEVVVTSNNTNLPDNIPYSVQTVSKDELRKTGAITPMQALSYHRELIAFQLVTELVNLSSADFRSTRLCCTHKAHASKISSG